MHPIFISHLIADFLLQPTWLANWKQKNIAGIILHALIHCLVLVFLLFPNRFSVFLAIVLIGGLHGIIDYLKIRFQKNNGTLSLAFVVDQVLHLAVLTGIANLFQSFTLSFWNTEVGSGILSLLIFYSIGMAIWNLVILSNAGNRNRFRIIGKIAMIGFVLFLFLIPAKLFAISSCFGL